MITLLALNKEAVARIRGDMKKERYSISYIADKLAEETDIPYDSSRYRFNSKSISFGMALKIYSLMGFELRPIKKGTP